MPQVGKEVLHLLWGNPPPTGGLTGHGVALGAQPLLDTGRIARLTGELTVRIARLTGELEALGYPFQQGQVAPLDLKVAVFPFF